MVAQNNGFFFIYKLEFERCIFNTYRGRKLRIRTADDHMKHPFPSIRMQSCKRESG